MSEAKATAPLRLRERLAYGSGDFASVLYWQTFMVYLTYYYTDVFGLSAAAAATLLGVSRALDALLDPLMGLLADRTRSRFGAFRPYLLWGCGPLAVLGVLTFTTPDLSDTGKLWWAWISYNLLMIAYTAINIPYTALLGTLTDSPDERTKLSSTKFLFAFAAGMLVSALLLPGVQWLGAGSPQRGFSRAFLVVGLLAMAGFLIAFRGTKERVPPSGSHEGGTMLRDVRNLLRNRPWLTLVGSTLLLILFVALRGSVTAHYFKYYVGAQAWPWATARIWSADELVSAFNALSQAASLLGVLLLPRFSARLGERRAFLWLFSLAALCCAGLFVLQPSQLVPMFALHALGSLCSGPISALLWTLYADAADYGEWQSGHRSTGLVFAASAFSQKQGWALGAWASLSWLERVGFVPNQPQSADTLQGLRWLMSLSPAFCAVLSIAVMLSYPLSAEKMAEIQHELRRRRAHAA